VAGLRSAGEIVIARRPGQEAHLAEINCDRELVYRDERWQVVPLRK
jgi:ATP phosphoribosyltransferase regulatory subunit